MSNPVYPCLWFDGQAKEAADFYCSVFKDSRIISENPVVVQFEINGSRIMALNGGPHFKFNEAVSLVITCDKQDEIDYYWEKLTADGGQESMCGWLKDKFGLSWQVVPANMGKLMTDPERMQRIMPVLMQMKKLDMQKLEEA
jgi:predicted 3-demethylubiquinone-9 3-methyltransferase (glyoxalase superfamily)